MSRGPSLVFVPAVLLVAACAARAPTAGPDGTAATVPSASAIEMPRVADASEVAEPTEAADVADAVVVEVAPAAPASDDDIICRRESVTGSHQKREVCTTRAQRRAERRDAQEWHRSGGMRGGISRVPTVR